MRHETDRYQADQDQWDERWGQGHWDQRWDGGQWSDDPGAYEPHGHYTYDDAAYDDAAYDDAAYAGAAVDVGRPAPASAPAANLDPGAMAEAARVWLLRATGLAETTPGVDRSARLVECALAVIFYWFGFLKLFPNVSPAEELAGRTVEVLTLHLLPFRLGVMLLGLLEVGLAIGLYLIPRYTWVLWLALAHLVGTFVPFLLFPEMTLGRVPGSLSLAGQYIVKNLVLLGAVWFLIEHHRTLGLKLRRR